VSALPPGFKLTGCIKRGIGDPAEVSNAGSPAALQAVFSDGLAHVSLFIEPWTRPPSPAADDADRRDPHLMRQRRSLVGDGDGRRAAGHLLKRQLSGRDRAPPLTDHFPSLESPANDVDLSLRNPP
jgi:hypothetical protein